MTQLWKVSFQNIDKFIEEKKNTKRGYYIFTEFDSLFFNRHEISQEIDELS